MPAAAIDAVVRFANNVLWILNESSIYLLIGFALAGVLHVVLRRTPRFTEMLARRGGRSVVLASVLGAPLPLCSCGVVPAGLTLRRRGASKGATVSFLVSVPETDVVSILLTYGLLGGPVMAIARPVAALITAMIAGLATNALDRDNEESPTASGDDPARSCGRDGDTDVTSTESDRPRSTPDHTPRINREYDETRGPIWNAWRYGFVTFFDDIIAPLLLGMILGGLITLTLPHLGLERIQSFSGGAFLTMLAMLAIGAPMYVCATASTPIAAGLILGGVSPGAALVFLLAGPATNLGTLFVLRRELGGRTTVVYLASIAVVSIVIGLGLDVAIEHAWLPAVAPAPVGEAWCDGLGAVKTIAAVALLVLAGMTLYRRRLSRLRT